MRENEEGKLFEGCLVGSERWKNNSVFFSSPPKSFLPKMERKLGGEKSNGWLTKMPTCKLHMGFSVAFFFFLGPWAWQCLFCFSSSSSLFIYFLFFGLDVISFSGHDFYFFNKFGWFYFSWLFVFFFFFWVLIGHHF